jgi:predicted amidophosphoribosyltransferase
MRQLFGAFLGAGGPIDTITPVPSKRGIAYAHQPLRKLLSHFGAAVGETLRCARAALYGRRSYTPEMFDLVTNVRGKRLLVIEDTWATGATALSACGASTRASRHHRITHLQRRTSLHFSNGGVPSI